MGSDKENKQNFEKFTIYDCKTFKPIVELLEYSNIKVLDGYIFDYTNKGNNCEITWTPINDQSSTKEIILEEF